MCRETRLQTQTGPVTPDFVLLKRTCLLLPHAVTTTPYTCLCNCNYTPLTEPTNRSRDHGILDSLLTHGRLHASPVEAQTRQLEAWPQIPCFIRHMCVRAVTDHDLWVLCLLHKCVHVRVCVCVLAWEETTRSQVTTAPPAAKRMSAHACNTHLFEVTHPNITKAARATRQPEALLLQHKCARANNYSGFSARPCACV